MADFPPNSDFSSGVFSFDQASSSSSRRYEDLTRQFAAFTLLQRDRHSTSVPASPMFQRFRQPIRSSSSTTSARYSSLSSNGGFDVAHNVTSYETRAMSTFDPTPSHLQYHQHQRFAQNREIESFLQHAQNREIESFLQHAQNREIESILQLRARLLVQMQNEQQSRSQLQLTQRSRVRVGTNFVPKSEGTGVFIPRIASSTSTTTAIDNTSHHYRRKPVRNRREAPMNQLRSSTSRIATEQHEDWYCQEIALPHDWTY